MIERTFIEQGMKKIELESYIRKQLGKAGFTGLNVVKTPLVTRIVLNVTRPGLAIGKGGQNIKQLTRDIEEKFGFNNPQIEIQEIQDPALNAMAVVDKVVMLLERGYSWRSVSFKTMRDIQKAGAQGVELILSGKLAGKGGRKRRQRIASGYMKKVGNQTKLVEFAKASAYPKAGAIGVKIRIIKPNVVFPDKINFKEFLKKKAEAVTGQEQVVVAVPVAGESVLEKAVQANSIESSAVEKPAQESAEETRTEKKKASEEK